MARRNLPTPDVAYEHVVIENVPEDVAEIFNSMIEIMADRDEISQVEAFRRVAMDAVNGFFSEKYVVSSMASTRSRNESLRINKARRQSESNENDGPA